MEKNPVDLVVTDIKMPVLDGLELIRQSKEADYPAKFLILSGYDDFAYAQKALRYGADDYILKPIKEEELLNALIRIPVFSQAPDHAAPDSRPVQPDGKADHLLCGYEHGPAGAVLKNDCGRGAVHKQQLSLQAVFKGDRIQVLHVPDHQADGEGGAPDPRKAGRHDLRGRRTDGIWK